MPTHQMTLKLFKSVITHASHHHRVVTATELFWYRNSICKITQVSWNEVPWNEDSSHYIPLLMK